MIRCKKYEKIIKFPEIMTCQKHWQKTNISTMTKRTDTCEYCIWSERK